MPDRERVIAGLGIQRDEMCGSFCDKCPYFSGGEGANAHCGFEDLCNDAIKLIQEAPEIVQCKDCKHYDGDENSRLGTCLENGVCSTPEWFCADGERRTDDA